MVKPGIFLLAATLGAVGLAGCSNTQTAANRNVCVPFPAVTTTTTTTTTTGQAVAPVAPPINGDPAAAVEDCLHRWGYALAASSDDANQVATATVAACGPSIARWNQASLASNDGGGPTQAPSLLTGQETTPITEHFIFAQGRALLYVVQARAGKCPVPPMANGVPTGVAD
jgi:hypothetical protein